MGYRAASSIAVIVLILSGYLVFVATPAAASGATYTVNKQRFTLSGNPISAALDYTNHNLYIATQNGYILVFDPAAGHIVANISVPLSNGRIAYDNQTGFLYVSNGSAIVSINGATNSAGSVIQTPNFFSYTFTYGAGLIYVAGANLTSTPPYTIDSIEVLNPALGKFVANITTPHITPFQSAYDSVDNRLYVTSPINSTVLAIDLSAHRIVATIPVPNGPWGLTYGGGDVYVTEGYSNITAVISTATEQIVANLKGGNAPISVAYVGDPFGVAAYYGNNGMGGATWYDYTSGNTLAWTSIPNGPEWVLYDRFITTYYVIDYEGFLDGLQLVPTSTSSSSSSTSSSTSTFTSSSALFSSQSSTQSTSTTSASTSTSSAATSVTSSVSVGVPGGLGWLDYAIIGIIVLLILLALFYLWWFRGLFGGKAPPPEEGPKVGKTPPPPVTPPPPKTPPPPIPVGPVVYPKPQACTLNTYWEFEQFTLTATVGEEKNPANVPSAVLHHSTVKKPAGEPIPMSAVAEDKHIFVHSCSCDNIVDQKYVHLYALVKFEWQVTYGGGTFVRITGGPGKSAEVGDQVIYQPPDVPEGKIVDVKVEVKALHGDPSKPPDHGPIILGINMKIKREDDQYLYEWWPASIASVSNPVNVFVSKGPCVTSGVWNQDTLIQGLISATLMIPGTSRLPLERPSGECAPGDYVRFEFKGDDTDDFDVTCTPEAGSKCLPNSGKFPMLDRLNCDWSSTQGEFVKSISKYSLVAIWHAPDKEADVDIQVKVSDSQTQFVDRILVIGTKVLVRKKPSSPAMS